MEIKRNKISAWCIHLKLCILLNKKVSNKDFFIEGYNIYMSSMRLL